ncbi:MAG TPA: DUF192 domain-containing protein [Candidatus Saccharimonadales bacterium]
MSLRKDSLSWAFIGLGLAVIGVTAYFVLMPQIRPQLTVRLGDGVFDAIVVRSAQNETYDVNKHSLRQNQAILRIHDSSALWSVDVKKRTAVFDLVWLNDAKKVVYIVKHASGDSVPETTFRPTESARYVIEFSGGTVESKSIHIGGTAFFDESLLKENKG